MDDQDSRPTSCMSPRSAEPSLHRAARVGDCTEIHRLVGEGADVNAVIDLDFDPDAFLRGVTPLMVAAGSGDGASVETVKTLLDLGADPTIVIQGHSAASSACRPLGWNRKPGGDAARLEMLLAAGSPLPTDPEAANEALCGVAAAGDPKRLEILLGLGFNARGYFNSDEARKRHIEYTKWHHERYRKNEPDIIDSLPTEMRGPMAETVEERLSKEDSEEREELERASSAPNWTDIPLFQAARSGHAQCVSMLLAAGADALVRDQSSTTAMHEASSVEVVRLLLEAGLTFDDVDMYGWSPMVAALHRGRFGVPSVRAFIAAGANVNARLKGGFTVFMAAVGFGRNLQVLPFLVEVGADPHAVDDSGWNAYHAAIDLDSAEANSEDYVRDTFGYLKELGVNIEQRTSSDRTPLLRALVSGTEKDVRVLCELGANPNAVCNWRGRGCGSGGGVPLPLIFHAADGFGAGMDLKIEELLKGGANPLVEDADRYTPLAYAVSRMCDESQSPQDKYSEFFGNRHTLHVPQEVREFDRDSWVSAITPIVRKYVETWASDIPIPKYGQSDDEWRAERISCIVSLCAYEGWARSQHQRVHRPDPQA